MSAIFIVALLSLMIKHHIAGNLNHNLVTLEIYQLTEESSSFLS